MAGLADFIKHRKYFVCFSPATLGWYEYCFGWIPQNPSQADLQNAVIAMRERGLKPTPDDQTASTPAGARAQQSGSVTTKFPTHA